MLFHTWPFLIFLLIVLPVFFALRKTPLWLLWLLAASYFFYGLWNPYCLLLVLHITVLNFFLVALMERCPARHPKGDVGGHSTCLPRLARLHFDDRALKIVFVVSTVMALGLLGVAFAGPKTLRATVAGLGFVALLVALGSLVSSRRAWLVIGLAANLLPLLFFKYARFFAENLNAVLSWLHVSAAMPDPSALMPFGFHYLLPVGISFFTFQSMSYVIDVYLGKTPRERNPLRFANFVCFFPIVMSGPIERAGHLLPQFAQFPAIRMRNVTDGLSLFLVGLFKKLALAGYLSLYVNRVYDNPRDCGAPALILGTVMFGWQLFFDFSGYTDMARGVGKLMGFDLLPNFNSPYLATGLGDFWRRWHISFTRWILDYIFMPLQMYWRDWRLAGTAAALIITFLASGIWHGAAWTFVIWGALHGLGLAATFSLERSAFYRKRVPTLLKQAAVFIFVSFAWIFFRADSLGDALWIVRRILTAAWQDPQAPALMLALVVSVWLYQYIYESRFRRVLETSFVRVGLAVVMALCLGLFSSGGGAFIYFQF